MKTCYIDRNTRSIADLVAPGELFPTWVITRINVPREHRGKGHGSALLKRILVDADVEQVTLALEVFPSGPLDYDDLMYWYHRHGFRSTKSGYMVRKPSTYYEDDIQ